MKFPTVTPRSQLLLAASAVLIVIANAAVHPTIERHKPLLPVSDAPPSVLATLQRACQDCHSQNTAWPWYSAIPPISWQIYSDVDHGRQFMDFSKWNTYSDAQKRGMLISMDTALQTRAMPPAKYLLLHPNARLSDADQQALQGWAKAAQQRLRK